MKLLNFKLQQPSVTTNLVGLGFSWDLHSFAEFTGLVFYPERNEVVFTWTVPLKSNSPWADQGNMSKSCKLVFKKVKLLIMNQSDAEIPQDESRTLENLSMIDPQSPEYPNKDVLLESDEFHLLFVFGDGRKIQINADSAELQNA